MPFDKVYGVAENNRLRYWRLTVRASGAGYG